MSAPRVSVLDCGMPLIVEPMAGVKSVALCWLLPAGDASEPEEQDGRAAVTREMLLRGAGDLGSREQADAFDRLGVSRSAENGRYFMRVSATLTGDKLAEAAPLIVDMVLRPRFDGASFEPVRELCVQSLESLKDDPQRRAGLAARALHFPPPLNRSGFGTRESLRGLTVEDVRAGWSERARPKGSILAVAGAVDGGFVASLFGPLLDGWSGEAESPVASGEATRGMAHAHDDSAQTQIVVLMDGPRESDPEAMTERALLAVLSGGMSGRLFTEVREKRGLCYSVSASYVGDREFGTVQAYVGTTPERAQESLDVLLEQMALAYRPGSVQAEEFERAMTGLKARLVFKGESTGARAASLAHDWNRLGRARSLEEMLADLEAVTLDRLNGYLEGRSLGRMTIQTMGPEALRAPEGVDVA